MTQAIITKVTISIKQKIFKITWEQRNPGEVLINLQSSTLTSADLSTEQGIALNVVLIKFGEYLDVRKKDLPMIVDSTIVAKYKDSFLRNGDVIVADIPKLKAAKLAPKAKELIALIKKIRIKHRRRMKNRKATSPEHISDASTSNIVLFTRSRRVKKP